LGIPAGLIIHSLWQVRYVTSAVVSGVVMLGVFGISPLVAKAYRQRRGAGLQRQLIALPPEQRMGVLLSLRQDAEPEVRNLVEPLLRSLLRHHAELTPSDAPMGRGDEPTPTG
jgi:hypothetical protein